MLDLKYLKQNFEDKSISEIALHLKRDSDSVRIKASRIGLSKVRSWTNDELNFIRDNYKTMSDKEIAFKLDVTSDKVKGKRSGMGWRKYRNR